MSDIPPLMTRKSKRKATVPLLTCVRRGDVAFAKKAGRRRVKPKCSVCGRVCYILRADYPTCPRCAKMLEELSLPLIGAVDPGS